ncbi:MAG: 16S rRNA (cytidine(1402)-2'-O)-methyltransferase [Alphaproteobacteria bacterium]|nr:16S rRNA (cytidine(1402)-2'-O)-methyltransferase [Alphaproteobacteria bacterium]MCY4317873.1 16S rRNA (cytidine(1402)-2'-O)-methyltransferase [Alphaproteobacteria bacterium]
MIGREVNPLDPARKASGDSKESLLPGLYLVATPIGNARDITLRALDILAAADLIACEDTRVTRRLLQIHGLNASLTAYHDHNAERVRPKLLAAIRAGKSVALACDAGMPLVSDPGFSLVRATRAEGLPVTSAPGANAALTALQLSGLAPDRFSFLGFLPSKQSARRRALAPWASALTTLLVHEAGPRLADCLADMATVLGAREVAVARELTKRHEEVVCGRLDDLAARYAEAGPPKGEIVVIVGPPAEVALADVPDALLVARITTLGLSRAASELAAISGRSRRDLYKRGLELLARRE